MRGRKISYVLFWERADLPKDTGAEQIGITCEEMKDKDTRKLIFVNEEYKLRFSWQRVPTFPPM